MIKIPHSIVILIIVVLFHLCCKSLAQQQVELTFTTTNTSSTNTCTGKFEVQCVGCPAPVNCTWYDTANVVVGTGNYISNLCFGTSDIVYINDNSCRRYIGTGIVASANHFGPMLRLKVKLTYTNSSVNATILQITGAIGPCICNFQDEMGTTVSSNFYNPNFPYLDVGTTSVATSDPVSYNQLSIQDSLGSQIAIYFKTLRDSGCIPGSDPLWVSAQGYPVSDSALCDGTATATAYGGTPPYTYQFSSGSTNSTATGLCPSSYIVTVTDADSNSVNTSFVVGYPGTIYVSDTSNLNYLDTLYADAYQNCGLDYNLPVDTFYIDSVYAVSDWIYSVNWVIWQNSVAYNFSETYYIDTIGNYMFGLSVFCNARSSLFGSYSFMAGYTIEPPITTSVNNTTNDHDIRIYPNPAGDVSQLTSSATMKGYVIYNQLGQVVSDKKIDSEHETIEFSKFPSGIYNISVTLKDGSVYRQKIVKL